MELIDVATAALAVITLALVCVTWLLAKRAREQIVANQRPVVTAHRAGGAIKAGELGPQCPQVYEGMLRLAVRNVGSGPALNVNGRLIFPFKETRVITHPAIANGETVLLSFVSNDESYNPDAAATQRGRVDLYYFDVGGNRWESELRWDLPYFHVTSKVGNPTTAKPKPRLSNKLAAKRDDWQTKRARRIRSLAPPPDVSPAPSEE